MSDEAIKSSSEVLSSGYVTQGPIVDKFEKLLMSYFSNEQVVTTNSATSGLHLIIHMLKEYGLGDQKVKIEDLHKAIAKVGYDTDKVRANDDDYASLHSCCKYER